MYKLKKGIDKLSSKDLKIISVLLESLTINQMTRIYYSMTKNFLIKKFHNLKNKNTKKPNDSSKTIADFLNAEYSDFSYHNSIDTNFILNLLELKFKQKNSEYIDDTYYNILFNASKLYLLPKELTPALKADLISTNAYIIVLENLIKILDSLDESNIELLESSLDSLIIEMEDSDHVVLENIFDSKRLTGKKTIQLLTKKNFIHKIVESNNIPIILINMVNAIINVLCKKDKAFTQIDSKHQTFVLFQANEKVYWIIDTSPYQIIKGSKYITQEIASLIIFLSKVLIGETYIAPENQLPSFNLTHGEKDTLLKRKENFKNTSFKRDNKKNKLKVLKDDLEHTISINRDFLNDKKKYEEIIKLRKKELIALESNRIQSEEKLAKLLQRYDALQFKQGSNPRIKKKLLSLKASCDDLQKKIETINGDISKSKNIINEKKHMKEALEIKLLDHNKKLSTLKIEIALLKKDVEAYDQRINQLKTSNAIYFSLHWGKYFDTLKISPKIYNSLINYNIDSLLMIEKVLVELEESTAPRAVGYKINENTYEVKITDANKTICYLTYKINNNHVTLEKIKSVFTNEH